MKRRVISVCMGAALALLGAGVYAAQENSHSEEHRALTLVNPGAGHGRLGVTLTDVNSEKARDLKLASESGALITKVEPDSPAAKAGLDVNDVILEFDGERVRSVAELRRLIHDTPGDRTVSVKVSRGGQVRTVSVKLETATAELIEPEIAMPEFSMPEIHVPNFNFQIFDGGARLGISAEELTPQLAQYFGVAQGGGVLVEEVESGSAAEKAGLKAGDCIVRAGDTKVESIEDLHLALRGKTGEKEKQEVNLTIIRDRHEQTLKVELEATSSHLVPRRMARDNYLDIDPSEIARMKAEILANSAALREARQGMLKQSQTLMQGRRQLMEELRRAKKSMANSSWYVD